MIMLALDYVIYRCSSSRTTPGATIYYTYIIHHYRRGLHWRKNSVAVITQDRLIDDNLKRKIKNQTLHTCRLCLMTRF